MKKLVLVLLVLGFLFSGMSALAQGANADIDWRGHVLRPQFVTREDVLVNAGRDLLPSVGGFVMLRFTCDDIPLHELFTHREDFVMLNEYGSVLDSAAICVNGVILEPDTITDGVCGQFDAIFYLETYDADAFKLISFEVRSEDSSRVLPISQLADRDYSLRDNETPDNERDFSWALERVIGETDAYKLLFALCAVRTDAEQAFAEAHDYDESYGISEAFTQLCSEVVDAKLNNRPNGELAAYLEGNLLHSASYSADMYRVHLIESMDITENMLHAMDDGQSQYGYPCALWSDAAFEGFCGESISEFIPQTPRNGYYLITVSPETQTKPNTIYDAEDEAENSEVRNYAHSVVEGIDTLLMGTDYTLTGNPSLASVRLTIDMRYESAGTYQGVTGTINAYNSILTLTAYDMLNCAEIAALTAERAYGSTISTYQQSGTIWCSAPDLETAEGADDFVAALLAHVPGKSVETIETYALTDAPEQGSDTPLIHKVLEALNEPQFTSVYEYLAAGNTIQKGENSDYGKCLQTLLVALGKDISIDGQVGNKTIAAMNEVCSALNMEGNDIVTAPCFERLLVCLLCMWDEGIAYDILVNDGMDEDEITYLRACGLLLAGKNYQAYQMFDMTGWEDANERAEYCVLQWPKNGEIYRNNKYSGKNTHLKISIGNQDEDYATLVKIYAQNDDLVSCLFIAGSGAVTVKIPGGTYTIKTGVGKNWFGVTDAFGNEGYYETLLFDGDSDAVTLKSGYEYQLTINTSSSDPNADGVGSEYENWSEF